MIRFIGMPTDHFFYICEYTDFGLIFAKYIYVFEYCSIFVFHFTGADLVLTAWEVVCKHAVCGGASLIQCHKPIKGESNFALAA